MVAPTTDNRELVRISGRGGLVNITVDDSAPIDEACRTLRERLGRRRHLYSSGEVIVEIGKRILSHDQQERIREVIASESGLTVRQFWSEPEVLERERARIDALIQAHTELSARVNGGGRSDDPASAQRGLAETPERETVPDVQPQPQDAALTTNSEFPSVSADVARGTYRAGEIHKFPGNVVVVGNVNPGAQIIAQGDILVFGKLRGLAHAGAGGDSGAVILAMSTADPQLRIADYIWSADSSRVVAGQDRDGAGNGAIIARILNGAVHVSPYLKNHFIDHGGNPNER